MQTIIETTVIQIVSFGFASFALGLALCNGIWCFFNPSEREERRKRRDSKRCESNQNRND